MIVFLLTPGHAYTHRRVQAAADFRVESLTYEKFLAGKKLPRATYIFTDLDRVSLWGLLVMSSIYRQLQAQGVKLLNGPARVASRYGLLRQLYHAGINRFNAYRLEEKVEPSRYPVFLRSEGDHLGPIGQPVESPEALQAAIDEALGRGIPRQTLLIVEYAAQPVRPGLFRRLSIYKIGDRLVADTCVHDSDWRAKIGADGVAPLELYEDELRIVKDNPYREPVEKAFAMAGIDYGRADFGLIDGAPQIYEINTNPNVELLGDSPSPFRSESRRLCNTNYLEALRSIDTPDSNSFLEPLNPHATAANRVG